MLVSFVYFLLIITLFFGLLGLFFYQEYVAKIFCLSISYSSFLLLMVFLASQNGRFNEIVSVMTTILLVFAANLLVGIAIVKKIIKKPQDSEES